MDGLPPLMPRVIDMPIEGGVFPHGMGDCVMKVTDPVGVRTYSPDEEVARKAPSVICAVASRIFRLREKMKKFREIEDPTMHDVEQLVRDAIQPLPFEEELLSGDIVKVNEYIKKMPHVDYVRLAVSVFDQINNHRATGGKVIFRRGDGEDCTEEVMRLIHAR